MSAPIDNLLQRLDGVKRTGPNSWIALSPARDERTPSLAVKELDDGRVLVHDFGGSDVYDVLASIGLNLSDLFPPKPSAPGAGTPRQRRPWSASELLRLAAHEATLAVLITADITSGRDADRPRLIEAVRRLGEMAEAAHAR